jgi:hypothetical protein
MKTEKSIAYQMLAHADIGGEVAMHSVACVCIIGTRRMLWGLRNHADCGAGPDLRA